MSGDSNSADSDEDGSLLLTGLYSDIPVDDQKFYFHEIVIDGRTVTFRYSYCKQTRFDSVLVLDDPVLEDSMSILFAVGMCVCSWYWMGFYTSDIVISEDICVKCGVSLEMMPFWNELYHQTCLEFVYVNHIEYKKINFVLEAPQVATVVGEYSSCCPQADYAVLVPMGGKLLSFLYYWVYDESSSYYYSMSVFAHS